MTTPSPAPDARRSRIPTPTSGHHDAQWYRRVATKGSAAVPDAPPEGSVSDDLAWTAVSHIAAGILLYGGLGWLLGRWLGNEAAFVAGGVLVGVALGLFMVVRRLGAHAAGPETVREDRS